MWLEKIFSTNHSCLNDTKSVYLFQTLTVYPIYSIYTFQNLYEKIKKEQLE